MATLVEATEGFLQRFSDQWGAATPVTHDNESYDGVTEFVRLSVTELVSVQHTLGAVGGREYRRELLGTIQVFVPLNQGVKNASTLADTARKIYEGVSESSGVEYYRATVNRIGPSDGWFQMNVDVLFNFQERR